MLQPQTKSVRSFLRGRTLVLTGATGFLAKVFLEKLLWEQSDVRKVFLIITPRDGHSAKIRMRREIVETPLFGRLKKRHGIGFESFIRSRLVAIDGDLGIEGLGLSREDESAIINDAEVFVNSAATTTFNERFDTAVNINTLGPRRLLHLSSKCPNLVLMCHVSTAFVNGLRHGLVEERPIQIGDCISRELDPYNSSVHLDPYAEVALALSACTSLVRTTATWETFLHCVSHIKENDNEGESRGHVELAGKSQVVSRRHDSKPWEAPLSRVEPVLHEHLVRLGLDRSQMYGWQDTYVFTKAMGEQFLTAERGAVPLIFIRPSIVEGALREPFPGWIEGVRMADPLIVAYGKGLIRGFVGDPAGVLDIVPVDAVANVMLAAMPGNARSDKRTRTTQNLLSNRTLEHGHVYTENCLGLPSRKQPQPTIQWCQLGDDVKVYHVATSTLNPLKFYDFMRIISRHFVRSPLTDRRSGKDIVAEEKIKVFSSRIAFELDTWFRQGGLRLSITWFRQLIMPDSVSPAMKRRAALARRTLAQLRSMGKIYMPYTTYEARFRSDSMEVLSAFLCEDERKIFHLDLETLDWEDYLCSAHIPGLLRHALKK